MSDVAQDSSRQDYVHELLEKYSTDKFYILYRGSLTNHVSHAIIALHSLGAPRSYAEQYMEKLANNFETPDAFIGEVSGQINICELDKYLGKGKGFYQLRKYYETAVCNLSIDDAIGQFFPRLCHGMIGSAIHGLINLGYAYSVKSKTAVIDALAYLHFASNPLETDADLQQGVGLGCCSIIEVASKVKASRLHCFMRRKIEQAPWDTYCTDFQRKAAVLFTCKADDILNFVHQIKFPDNIMDKSLPLADRCRLIGKWLIDTALTIYTVADKRNDFFLLHGVTSAWALSQVLPCLADQADINKTLRIYLSILIAVYVCQDCPDLDLSHLKNEVAVKTSWEEIIKRTLYPPKDDEHIYKLVQVCHDMSRDDDNTLYKVAALVALDHPSH